MRKFLMVVLLPLLFPAVSMAIDEPASAAANKPPVKQAWIDLVKKDAQASGRAADEQAILQNLANDRLLAQEAVRVGIDKQPDFAVREEIKRQELLAGLMVQDYLKKNPVTEEMLKSAYADFKNRLGNKEYNIRHIELKTEDEAKDVIAQLSKGADFAALAKEKSLDASSKDKGGLVGWVAKTSLKPPLGDAVAKLQKGLFNTVPLQSNAGWHVLKVEEVRDLKAPAYEKVKAQLRQRLAAEQINKLLNSLRAQAQFEQTK